MYQYSGQFLSKQYLFMSQNAHNQPYQPTHGLQYISENQYKYSNYQSEVTLIVTLLKKLLTTIDIN